MKRSFVGIAGALSVAVVAGVALGAAQPVDAATAHSTAHAAKILIVSYPRLEWQDVVNTQPPVLDGLLARGAVASLSIRTDGPVTSLSDGYVTIGAGNRAGLDPAKAGRADNAPGGGVQVPPDEVAAARRAADDALFGAEPGALGLALTTAGRRTAVIANADLGSVPHREAALAMMDEQGRIAGGDVAPSLSVADAAAPGGARLDPAVVEQAFLAAWSSNDAVMVEMSDLERLDRAGPQRGTPARAAATAATLAAADAILSRLLAHVDLERDLVIVAAPAAPGDASALTVFGITGPGIRPGLARSATTRRDGYVTLPDIGPTVLDAFGLSTPDAMNATPIRSAPGRAFDAALARQLAAANTVAVFRDRTVGPVSVIYVVLQVLTYAAVIMVFLRRRSPGNVAVFVLLVILAVPPLTFLSGLVRYDELGLVGYVIALFAAAIVLSAAVWPLRRRSFLAPALALVTLNWLVQVVDIVLGGRLQLDTPLGYSPIVAGRFQGYGNLAFALLASAAIVLAAALVRYRRSWPAALAVLVVTVLVDGWPAFGSDVGGVLAAVPAFALLVMLLRGWALSWRRVAVVVAGTAAVILALALADLARPADARTHLGRFAASIGTGDAGVTVRRKVDANMHILTSSIFTLLVPVLVIGFVIAVNRRRGLVADVQRQEPTLRATLIALVVLAVLGFALNDSGIAIPAMMIGVVVPWLVLVTLETVQSSRAP